MKKPLHLLIAVLIAIVCLTACKSTGSANDYVGKWQNAKNANEQLEITQNGDIFLITVNDGINAPRTVTAMLHNGVLEFNAGVGTTQITHIKATDTLTMPASGGNAEYRRRQ